MNIMNANNGGNNNNTKRKPNNMQRHNNNNNNNNNRNRRFTNNGNGNGNRSAAEDTANVARIRRNATQSREKYQNMARDALSMGDRVLSENYLQHAEHYYRVLMELPVEEVRQPTPPRQQHQQPQAVQSTENTEQTQASEQEVTVDSLPAFITQPVSIPTVPEKTEE